MGLLMGIGRLAAPALGTGSEDDEEEEQQKAEKLPLTESCNAL